MIPRWMMQLPGLRVYAALEKSDQTLVAAKKQLKKAKPTWKPPVRGPISPAARCLGLSQSLGPDQAPIASATRLDDILRRQREAVSCWATVSACRDRESCRSGRSRQGAGGILASDRTTWHHTENSRERKYSTEDEQQFGPYTRALIHVFNSGPFLGFLENLTGIEGLMADPHLRGGGLHEIKRGGSLGVHADFNFYKRLNVYRRLNLIVYLNKGWQEEWGGHLELWAKGADRPAARIAPTFNRAVIFDTSNASYHGHPHPLACPEDQSRKSVALYYYSVDYPYDEDRAAHTTLFIDTPDHDH